MPELDELHDVPGGGLAAVLEQPVVRVERLHGGEVLVAHADDDDAHGVDGRVDDGPLGVLHVRDDAVSDDQQHEILGAVLKGTKNKNG